MIALFITEMHELPTFVLQLDTKNLLKLTPLDTELFSCFIVTKETCKSTNKLLFVYAKVSHPMQSRGCGILLWLQISTLLKIDALLLRCLVGGLHWVKELHTSKVNAYTMF